MAAVRGAGNGEGVEVDVGVVVSDRDFHGGVFESRHLVVVGPWRIVYRCDRNGHRFDASRLRLVGEGVGSMEIGVRSIGVIAVGLNHYAAVGRVTVTHHRERVVAVVDIGIVGQHVAGNRRVFRGSVAIRGGRRGIVDAVDGHRDLCGGGGTVAVGNLVGKGVSCRFARVELIELPVGVVVDGSIGIDGYRRTARHGDGTGGRFGVDLCQSQRVTVDIEVSLAARGIRTAEEVDRYQTVLVGGLLVIEGHGRIVATDDGDAHGFGLGGPIRILRDIIEGYDLGLTLSQSVEVLARIENQLVVLEGHRALAGVAHRLDRERVVGRVRVVVIVQNVDGDRASHVDAAPIRLSDERIVLSANGDGHGCRVRVSVGIGNRVGKLVRGRLAIVENREAGAGIVAHRTVGVHRKDCAAG